MAAKSQPSEEIPIPPVEEIPRFLLGDGDELLERSLNPSQAVRLAPCEERLWRNIEIVQDEEAAHPGSFWQNLGHICARDYWTFLRLIMRYRWADPWWHGEELCGFLAENEGDDVIIVVPREAGKSTIITGPYPSWKLASDPLLLTQITNATEQKASRMGRISAKVIEGNGRYRMCFPNVRPSAKWGAGGYFLDVSLVMEDTLVERNAPNIGTYGVGGNITGDHVGLQIHDDLINHKTYKSPVELEKAKDFFRESIVCCEVSGQIIVCCTRWNYYDLYGEILEGALRGHKGRFKSMVRGVWGAPGHKGTEDEIIWKQRKYLAPTGRWRKSGYTQQQLENMVKQPLGAALYLSKPLLEEDMQFDIDLVDVFEDIPFELAPIRRVGVECESQGRGFIGALQLKKRYEGRSFPVDQLTSNREKKELRIKNGMVFETAEGLVHVHRTVWRDLKKEMSEFPKGHDDLLDAAEYCRRNCKEPPPGQPPVPYLAVDVAYTDENYSDYTAMVVGCRYRSDFWILAARKFRTERPEAIVKMIFRFFDQFAHGRDVYKRATRPPPAGFRSMHSRPQRGATPTEGPEMTFDLSAYRQFAQSR